MTDNTTVGASQADGPGHTTISVQGVRVATLEYLRAYARKRGVWAIHFDTVVVRWALADLERRLRAEEAATNEQ